MKFSDIHLRGIGPGEALLIRYKRKADRRIVEEMVCFEKTNNNILEVYRTSFPNSYNEPDKKSYLSIPIKDIRYVTLMTKGRTVLDIKWK